MSTIFTPTVTDGLNALVQARINANPFCGELYIFRGKRGDKIKVLWYSQDELCLLYKRLSLGKFIWPQAESGTVSLSAAQLSMLLDNGAYSIIQQHI